jgi:peptidoglycan/LPS O-acetylase OafA/YrhL
VKFAADNGLSGRNVSFDALRGWAALVVMGFHVAPYFGSFPFASGYLAVDLFFVLSGYVIAQAYEPRLRAGMTFRKFVELRIVRIFPLFLVGLVLGLGRAAGALAIGDERAIDPASLAVYTAFNAVLLPVPADLTSIFPLNSPAWSLSLELFVNLLFAFALFRWRRPALVAICGIGASLLVEGALSNGDLNLGVTWGTYLPGLGRALWGFFAGVILARLPVLRLGRTASIWALVIASGLLVALLAADVSAVIRPWYDVVAALVLFPALIWLLAGASVDGWLGRFSGLIGDLSFPLYATHYPLLLPLALLMTRLHVPAWVGAVATAGICVCVAMILAVVDQRVRSWIGRRLHLRRSARLQVL